MAKIKYIYPTSPFYGKVKKNDDLISINDKKIVDVLDYMFFTETENERENIKIEVNRKGERLFFEEEVFEGDLRFEFENFLMSEQRSCKNKCVFCFIDQLPKGMRKTLYYKDDDFRLSLLYGNYVTLTNAEESDIDRIVSMRVSPLNISVHTTNPELRVKMMANPNASKIMEILNRFKQARINMRCQIVLCPGLNDGAELDRTMNDLKSLYPAVTSVSIVPVGLTKYREGLYPLTSFTKDKAKEAVEQINKFGDQCLTELGTRLFYVADELFQKAEISLPGYDYYEEFEQIENGVGMVISFAQEFMDVVRTLRNREAEINISLVTGVAATPLMKKCINLLKVKAPNMNCRIYTIKNDFFGHDVTVTGLTTGQDIINQLKDKPLGRFLLVPSAMLRDDSFLDDITIKDVEKALNVKIKVTNCSAEDLVDKILSSYSRKKRC
ncbi:MAG: radical SAM protein [Clostridiales bacterium]|nr:MAG: radical SAM protein [Clostridiales bacterium]